MKIRNYKRLSAGILFVFTIGTTACNSGNGEQVYLYDDNTFIENHTILQFKTYVFDDEHPNVPKHQHAVNKLVARKSILLP